MFYNLYFPTVGKLLLTDMLRAACHIFLALSTLCKKGLIVVTVNSGACGVVVVFGWHTAGSVPLFFGVVNPEIFSYRRKYSACDSSDREQRRVETTHHMAQVFLP